LAYGRHYGALHSRMTEAAAPASAAVQPGDAKVVALDRFDVAILRLLAAEARMSQRRLAREVGMSPPAVAERIARLERSGVIRGYRVDVDRRALGFGLVVYVGVIAIQGPDQADVVRSLGALPEVEDVHVVTGPKDLLVRLRVRDHEHLRELLFDRVWNLPGIERTETYISLGHMDPKDIDAGLLGLIDTTPAHAGGS
jgi:Lrp/AsnC family transcriptional regulator, leucine-responsive regulatory protein